MCMRSPKMAGTVMIRRCFNDEVVAMATRRALGRAGRRSAGDEERGEERARGRPPSRNLKRRLSTAAAAAAAAAAAFPPTSRPPHFRPEKPPVRPPPFADRRLSIHDATFLAHGVHDAELLLCDEVYYRDRIPALPPKK